jgi:hypothetical protein
LADCPSPPDLKTLLFKWGIFSPMYNKTESPVLNRNLHSVAELKELNYESRSYVKEMLD